MSKIKYNTKACLKKKTLNVGQFSTYLLVITSTPKKDMIGRYDFLIPF